MPEDLLIVSKEFRFEASHVLPKHPGQCSRLHGHSWKLTVSVQGAISPETGFVVDFADLKELVNKLVISKIDHQHLGYSSILPLSRLAKITTSPTSVYPAVLGPMFYPSSENLVALFVDILRPEISKLMQPCKVELPLFQCADEPPDIVRLPRLYQVELDETCTSKCTWRAE